MTTDHRGDGVPVRYEAARQKGLRDLTDALKGPLTVDHLRTWAAADAAQREPFLQDRVFGKIRWKKTIGRSLGPTLASGFAGEDWFHYLNWKQGDDGIAHDIGQVVRVSPDPSFWDLPDDGDFFQVGYGFWGVRPWMNAVVLKFAEGQPWDSPLQARARRTYRRIVEDEPYFYFGESTYVVLADATIEEVKIRFF